MKFISVIVFRVADIELVLVIGHLNPITGSIPGVELVRHNQTNKTHNTVSRIM